MRVLKVPFKSKAFTVGFFAGLLLFIAVNAYEYTRVEELECFDCYKTFGFPLGLYESGTFAHVEQILWGRLIANALIAVGISIGIGAGCHLIINKGKRYLR